MKDYAELEKRLRDAARYMRNELTLGDAGKAYEYTTGSRRHAAFNDEIADAISELTKRLEEARFLLSGAVALTRDVRRWPIDAPTREAVDDLAARVQALLSRERASESK